MGLVTLLTNTLRAVVASPERSLDLPSSCGRSPARCHRHADRAVGICLVPHVAVQDGTMSDVRDEDEVQPLTVAELIEQLKELRQDLPVKFDVSSAGQFEGFVGVYEVDTHHWHDFVVLSA
jgi:hypothetical protein